MQLEVELPTHDLPSLHELIQQPQEVQAFFTQQSYSTYNKRSTKAQLQEIAYMAGIHGRDAQ